MNDGIKKFLIKGLWTAIVLLLIRYFIGGFETIYDYVGAASEAISFAMILMGSYSTFLWKFNPLEKLPKVMGKYEGTIEYLFNDLEGEKKVTVLINQTLLTTSVRIITDEISSKTITSSFLFENGEYVLYYTYITNPKAKFSTNNPIQFGTCRLQIEDKNHLNGIYWTSRHTAGDIFLERIVN